jgi:hypothetical protein
VLRLWTLLLSITAGLAVCGCSAPTAEYADPGTQKVPASATPTTLGQRSFDSGVTTTTEPADNNSSTDNTQENNTNQNNNGQLNNNSQGNNTQNGRGSGGSGGRIGNVEKQFTDSSGLGSSYKMVVPNDVTTKLYGLHIHLHGDGGGGYRDFPNREPRFDLIGVTVKAPNTSLTWGRSSGVRHSQYLQDLIQRELLRLYNIDRERIYFSGVSGGAYFLAGSFIPTFGASYRSGAFLMCGGEAPRSAFNDPQSLSHFKTYFQVTAGERQDILTSMRDSFNAYQRTYNSVVGAGNTQNILGSEIVGSGGHCEFDGRAYTSGIQSMILQKFNVVLWQ